MNEILDARQKTHGDFSQLSVMSQSIKLAMRTRPDNIPADVREALEMIAVKMSRIVCGDWRHKDSWDDIIGYAELIARSLTK